MELFCKKSPFKGPENYNISLVCILQSKMFQNILHNNTQTWTIFPLNVLQIIQNQHEKKNFILNDLCYTD